MSDDPRAEGRPALAGLELELARLAEDFRVVDRGLLLDGRPLAELVAVVEGRPALVVVVDGEGHEALARALAALALARATPAALRLHVGLAEGAGGPRVLLIAERAFAREFLERVRLLAGADLWLFERHQLESERGSSAFLVRVATGVAEPGPAQAPPVAGLQPAAEELLDPALVQLATDLAERLARLDPGVACTESASGLTWTLDGGPLCRLGVEDGRLVARLAGSEVPHRIGSPPDVDVFVDWVLSVHLAGLEERAEEQPGSAPSWGPILTREEIEAFRA